MILKFLKRNLPGTFLTQEETCALTKRVAEFEDRTSCELVFHFRRRLGKNPVHFNEKLFFKFGLQKTESRRGILITLALVDRKFAVWADKGIADHCGEKFWLQVTENLSRDLKSGPHLTALLNAISLAEKLLAGISLKPTVSHKNELSNAPIIEGEDER